MMYIQRVFALVVCLSFCVQVGAQQNDAALWTNVSLEKKVVKGLKLQLNGQLRINNNISTLSNSNASLKMSYKVSKSIVAGLEYQYAEKNYVNNRLTSDYFATRHQVNFNLSFRRDFGKFRFNYRSMLQTREKDIFEDFMPYKYYFRNRLGVKYPINRYFTPYLSHELYYRFNAPKEYKNKFERMRTEAGLVYTFTRNDDLEVFYLIRQDIRNSISDRDFIIGLGYSHKF